MYTTYRYRVTVYNDFGQVTSSPSEEVTTFGGVPTKPPIVEATVIDHVSIEVKWQTPSKWLVTARIPKEWGRYRFHRCLSVHISGVGTPIRLTGGTLIWLMGGYPHLKRGGGLGWTGWGYPPPPVGTGQGNSIRDQKGGTPSRNSAAGAVCLLRSRRRTF